MSFPNGLAYVDSDASYQSASEVSFPVLSCPFPGVNSPYLLTQDFVCYGDYFSPLALNTVHVDAVDANGKLVIGGGAAATFGNKFYLVSEGPRNEVGGGVVRWTRTYARVPARYEQPSSMTYTFIGYMSNTLFPIRPRVPKAVPSRIQFDYYLLDKTSGNIYDSTGASVYAGAAGTLPGVIHVPTIGELRYFAAFPKAVALNMVTDYIGYQADIAYPVPNPGDAVNYPPYASYPTRDVYEGWIAAGTEIVAQASVPNRWMGNIIERQTVYILPQ